MSTVYYSVSSQIAENVETKIKNANKPPNYVLFILAYTTMRCTESVKCECDNVWYEPQKLMEKCDWNGVVFCYFIRTTSLSKWQTKEKVNAKDTMQSYTITNMSS